MRKTFYTLAVAFAFVACQSGSSKQAIEEQATGNQAVEVVSYKVETLLADAANIVGDTIRVEGTVTHTCKHSGRRCFIVGADNKTSIRIEAKGEIGGFNKELIGSDINVIGILRENRLSAEEIDQAEEGVKARQGENGDAESCETELANINHMKEWMKENNKDYFANYYIDGLSYDAVANE